MVVVGYVIEKDEKALTYFNRFIEVFKVARASCFSKKKLFDNLDNKINVFDDRLVFVYSGKITAFSFVRYLSWYAIITLLIVFVLLGGVLSGLLKDVLFTLLSISVVLLGSFYILNSSTYWWGRTERNMNKKKFGLRNYQKKLLSNQELINCFLWNKKPLFKKESRVEN